MQCSLKYFILLCGISVSQAAFLTYYGPEGQNVTADMDNPTVLFPHLNTNKTTMFFTHGVGGKRDGRYIATVITTFSKDHNLILYDWTEEAEILFNIAFLSYIVYNAPSVERLAYKLAEAIAKLIEFGLKLVDIFLMGFSLGAHLMGAAGRRLIELGYTILRIIALDPSGALYTKYFPVFRSVDSSCATNVFKIITDPNGYGDSKANCHVNVYANSNTGYTMQPGCTQKADQITINNETACSHDMSWRLLCASKDHSSLLKAQRAADGEAWLKGLGDGVVIYISVNVTGKPGSFFLRTGPTYPYGLGDAGTHP